MMQIFQFKHFEQIMELNYNILDHQLVYHFYQMHPIHDHDVKH